MTGDCGLLQLVKRARGRGSRAIVHHRAGESFATGRALKQVRRWTLTGVRVLVDADSCRVHSADLFGLHRKSANSHRSSRLSETMTPATSNGLHASGGMAFRSVKPISWRPLRRGRLARRHILALVNLCCLGFTGHRLIHYNSVSFWIVQTDGGRADYKSVIIPWRCSQHVRCPQSRARLRPF